MTINQPHDMHSTSDLGSCHGVVRNNQLFLYLQQKHTTKIYAMLHVKLFD